MNAETKKLISIIVPVFNEADNIEPFYDAVAPVLESLEERYKFEIIFTDNHSTDDTFRQLESLAEHDPVLKSMLNFKINAEC
mgnify:CR=1 FL=1